MCFGLFSLHVCSPTAADALGGPAGQQLPPAPRVCKADSRSWLFVRAGQGLGPVLAAVFGMCLWRLVERTGAAGAEVQQWAAGQPAVPWGSGGAECPYPTPTEGLCCSLPATFSLSPLAGCQQGEARLLGTGLFTSRVTPRPRLAPAQPPSLLAPEEVVSQAPAPTSRCWVDISAEVT